MGGTTMSATSASGIGRAGGEGADRGGTGARVVRAAIAGDLAAFEALTRAYQTPVWRFLRHLLGDETLAEDVTQETFLRLHQRLPSFTFRSKFSTWVFRVARNAGIDALRSRGRQERLLEALPPPGPAPGPDLRVEVQAALASLSPKLRDDPVRLEGVPPRVGAAVDLNVGRNPTGLARSRIRAWSRSWSAGASPGAAAGWCPTQPISSTCAHRPAERLGGRRASSGGRGRPSRGQAALGRSERAADPTTGGSGPSAGHDRRHGPGGTGDRLPRPS